MRRVPKEYQHLDTRTFARVSTGIRVVDDPRGVAASRILPELNAQLERQWKDLAAGREPDQRERFGLARLRAAGMGLHYSPVAALAGGPLEEIIRRLDMLEQRRQVDEPRAVEAVLGGAAEPDIYLSEIVDLYKEEQGAYLTTLSPNQARKWENPKKRALENLLKVVPDKRLVDLTRTDALAFRKWWQDRIVRGDVEIATANKDIGHISKMLRVLEDAKQIGIPPVFRELRIEGEEDGQRTAFEPKFIQDVILKDGALAGLNDEARHVIYIMVETGLRPVEIVNLTPECIHLNAEVPHVEIKPVNRQLKTRHSKRKIPLVGCALMAMKKNQRGFPRYFDRSATLSASVNKFMDENGMRPSDGHSLYSLRHTFEDRLTAVEAPEKVIASLMGHKWQRPKYGQGPTLELYLKWLTKIAFRPPASV